MHVVYHDTTAIITPYYTILHIISHHTILRIISHYTMLHHIAPCHIMTVQYKEAMQVCVFSDVPTLIRAGPTCSRARASFCLTGSGSEPRSSVLLTLLVTFWRSSFKPYKATTTIAIIIMIIIVVIVDVNSLEHVMQREEWTGRLGS
jgi:hypothetical protein